MEPYLCFDGGIFGGNGMTTLGGHRTPKSYENNVHLASEFFCEKNVRITALDWLDCLEAEQLGPDDFVFIDYPYIGCDVGAYSAESICPTELIEYLKSAPFKWVLTEYYQPLYVQAFGEPVHQKEAQLRTTNFADTGGQERRIECIWTNSGENWANRDSVSVQPKPVPEDRKGNYYIDLPQDELLREIRECIATISAARNQMNAEMRQRLLPALRELKKRTFRKKPNYYETLAAMGLNPDTVRQWFYRSRPADEVIELVEENTEQPDSVGNRDETPPPIAGDSVNDAETSELARLGNNGRYYGLGSDWATDPEVYDKLNKKFHFTLDPCASDWNHKCPTHYTEKENGLLQDWGTHTVFMNPPCGEELYAWMKKAYESSLLGATVVALVPADTDTAWFHEFALKGEISFLRGRLWFSDAQGERHQPYIPSIVVEFSPPCPLKLLYAIEFPESLREEAEAYMNFKRKTVYDLLNDTSPNDNSPHDGGTVT
jgi:site-specific DNA-methyltransferase (adenine-specific)